VIMNITGGSNLSLFEVNEAVELVTSASDPDVNMIFGAIIDDSMKDSIKVTVIATGFDSRPEHAPGARGRTAEEGPDGRPVTLRPFGAPSAEQLDIPTFLRNKNRRPFES